MGNGKPFSYGTAAVCDGVCAVCCCITHNIFDRELASPFLVAEGLQVQV